MTPTTDSMALSPEPSPESGGNAASVGKGGKRPRVAPATARAAAIATAVVGVAWLAVDRQWIVGSALWPVNALMLVAVIYLVGVGAGWLVDASCRIANTLGVSQVVIGLTVVAFGTSAPEAAVSLLSGFDGKGDITIANVVGSNIFNLGFILGGVALMVRGGLRTSPRLVLRDGPLLLGATLLLFVFVGGLPGQATHQGISLGFVTLLDLTLQQGEGFILFGALIAYLIYLYVSRDKEFTASVDREISLVTRIHVASDRQKKVGATAESDYTDEVPKEKATLFDIPLFLLGLGFVVGGCHVLVGSASEIAGGGWQGYGAIWFAKLFGVSDYVIGVTIIAAGTSAPEFAVSLIAAIRGNFALSAGNLLGSDVFNILGVVGLAGIFVQPNVAGVTPVTVDPAAIGSVLALSGMVAITVFFMWTGRSVSRLEGLILVLIGMGRWIWDFIEQAPSAM